MAWGSLLVLGKDETQRNTGKAHAKEADRKAAKRVAVRGKAYERIVYMRRQRLGSRCPATAGPHVAFMLLRLGTGPCEYDDEV